MVLEEKASAARTVPSGDMNPWLHRSMVGAFALIAILVGVDVAADFGMGASWEHIVLEIALTLLAIGAGMIILRHSLAARRRARILALNLGVAEAEAERWRREADSALRGLGIAMDQQFDRWGLSGAEREVALLLLKGLALKEIAQVRKTGGGTVRQQALAVYEKAGFAGRAEMSAFFLKGLFLP
jgi:DNA-binding CsgD family transcriptional regulator